MYFYGHVAMFASAEFGAESVIDSGFFDGFEGEFVEESWYGIHSDAEVLYGPAMYDVAGGELQFDFGICGNDEGLVDAHESELSIFDLVVWNEDGVESEFAFIDVSIIPVPLESCSFYGHFCVAEVVGSLEYAEGRSDDDEEDEYGYECPYDFEVSIVCCF